MRPHQSGLQALPDPARSWEEGTCGAPNIHHRMSCDIRTAAMTPGPRESPLLYLDARRHAGTVAPRVIGFTHANGC